MALLQDEIRARIDAANKALKEGRPEEAARFTADANKLTDKAMTSPTGGSTEYYSSGGGGGGGGGGSDDPYAVIKNKQADLLAAQKQARIQALSAQRKSALSALGQEETKVAPLYLQQRGNLSTTAQQAARGAEQSLAARGLTRGGSAVQGDIARNVSLQQGMSNIGTAEAGTLADIQARRTQAEQAYAQGVAQAESEAAAQAAQTEIARLMQAQQAQEATVANQAQAEFENQKMQQEQANKLQIEELRIAAQEANAQGDFARAQELAKYKNDLEAETIKLRASTRSSGGSGGGGSSSSTSAGLKLNSGQLSAAKAISSQIEANPGSLSSILSRITDPAVRAYIIEVYGSGAGSTATTQNMGALSGYPTSRTIPGTTSTVPSWLNTRNLPGLG